MNIMDSNIHVSSKDDKDSYNATQVLFGNKHNRSLKTDPELEEALEEDSQAQAIQRTITLSNS